MNWRSTRSSWTAGLAFLFRPYFFFANTDQKCSCERSLAKRFSPAVIPRGEVEDHHFGLTSRDR